VNFSLKKNAEICHNYLWLLYYALSWHIIMVKKNAEIRVFVKHKEVGMEIRRDIYLSKLISKKHNRLVKVITGLRRCGKSYLLFNLFRNHLLEEHVPEERIIEMAFDSFENKKYRNPEAFFPYLKEKIVDQEMCYILLDEVQLLDDFESVLNSLVRMEAWMFL
jgi:predicted AAA+ superfamily ATPase